MPARENGRAGGGFCTARASSDTTATSCARAPPRRMVLAYPAGATAIRTGSMARCCQTTA